MKKLFVVTLLVIALLGLTAGLAIAVWEDTKETQMMATISPLPGGTFLFTSSPYNCQESFPGVSGRCQVTIYNDSATIMTIDAVTVTTDYPLIILSLEGTGGVGVSVEPGREYYLGFHYLPDSEVEPGEVVFDIEVTCSGE